MIPLHRDEFYTFTFADDRLVPRFHLDGATEGAAAVYRLDPATGGPADRLADAVVGPGGWVELSVPLTVRTGDGFLVRVGLAGVSP